MAAVDGVASVIVVSHGASLEDLRALHEKLVETRAKVEADLLRVRAQIASDVVSIISFALVTPTLPFPSLLFPFLL